MAVGKLIQVNTTTVSNVSNFSLTGIDSDNNYIVVLNNLYMITDGARPRLRFTVSGTPDTSANYDYSGKDAYSNTAYTFVAETSATYFNGFAIGTNNTECISAIYNLYNFNSSSEYSFISYETVSTNNAGASAHRYGGMVLQVAQSCDGLNWHSSTNNISNATATLYKVV